MKALVIVDVQNDFVPGGRLEVPGGNKIIPVINKIQEKFDLVVATQDWHPQNHSSFASNHPGKKSFEMMVINGLDQVLWPDHCVQDSEGASIHPLLYTKRVSAIFRKGMDTETDSYSAFFDNGHKISTGLSGYLKEKGVTKLYFCGLAADICVYYSIRDAVTQGFSSVLIEDAVCALNEKTFEKIKYELHDSGVIITDSDNI